MHIEWRRRQAEGCLTYGTTTWFVLLPKRWVVERTFAWLGKYSRLSKDYEYLTESSEAFIYASMIHIMVRRLN